MRRVENERPSWMRSTEKVIGCSHVAGPQEVAVHRVDGAVGRHGAHRGDDRLREHLPAEDAAERHPLRRPGEDVLRGASTRVGEVEGAQQAVDGTVHRSSVSVGRRPLDAGGSGPPVRRRSLGSLDRRWFNDSRWPTAFRSATCTSSCSAPGASKTVPCASSRAPASSPCTPRSSTRAACSTRARPCSACARSRCVDDRGRSTRSCRCARSSSASCGPAPSSATTTSPDPSAMSRPPEVNTVTWAGISPPRGGWRAARRDGCRDARVRAPVRASTRSPTAIPEGTGEQLVQRVRSEVWGRGVDGARVRADRAPRSPPQPRLPRRRPGAPVRDRPVDAPLDAARPRARAPQALDASKA